ncbi:hypothetical protein SEA_MRWORMIE_85 [Gordonia phage MrWormie]|nr:hypothetical protein SEA_MRWORMIE_85 [Gordonia phage MrWormie]
MKKEKVAAFILGACMVGAIWTAESASSPAPEEPNEPVGVPAVQVTRVVEKEVPRPVGPKCKYYMKHVTELIEGQSVLSETKGRMKEVLDELQVNLLTNDPFVIKRLQGEMNGLQQQMNNAWHSIGEANAKISQYSPGIDDPCSKGE